MQDTFNRHGICASTEGTGGAVGKMNQNYGNGGIGLSSAILVNFIITGYNKIKINILTDFTNRNRR